MAGAILMAHTWLERLLAATQAAVEAQLAPGELSAMLAAGALLGHAHVCELLSDALVEAPGNPDREALAAACGAKRSVEFFLAILTAMDIAETHEALNAFGLDFRQIRVGSDRPRCVPRTIVDNYSQPWSPAMLSAISIAQRAARLVAPLVAAGCTSMAPNAPPPADASPINPTAVSVTKTSSTGLAGLFPFEGSTTTYTRPAMRRDDGGSRFTGTVSRFLPETKTANITRLDRKLQYALDIPKAEYTECPLGGCPVQIEKPQPQPTEQKQPSPTHDPGCTMKIASNTLDIKPSLQKRSINGFATDEYIIDWRLIFEDPTKRQSTFRLTVDTWNTAPTPAMRDAMALELEYARNASIAVSRDAGAFALPPQFLTLMTGYLANGLAAADRASLTNLMRQFEKVKGTPILMQLQVNFTGDACGGAASGGDSAAGDAGSPVKNITNALSGLFGKNAGDAAPAADPPLLSFTYEVQKYGVEGVHDAVFDPPPNFRRSNPR